MVADPLSQWAFTGVFLTLALYSVFRVGLDRDRWALVVGHVLHVAMSLDMAAMAWPWWERIDWLSQVVFFAASTGWFAALWALSVHPAAYRRLVGTHPWWHQAMHALMMGAMTWMVAVMSPTENSSSEGHAHHVLSVGAALPGIALTAALLAAGAAMAVDATIRLWRGERSWAGHAVENCASSVMNLGMAAMCLLMLAM